MSQLQGKVTVDEYLRLTLASRTYGTTTNRAGDALSLGWQVTYERETRKRKPTPKTDVLGPWRLTAVQRITRHEMVKSTNTHHGALSVRSRQADRVPGLMPRGGPTHATGGHPAPQCGARPRKRRANVTGQTNPNSDNKTRPLNILLWNAEGAYQKKISVTERLHRAKINVACIQETHLNPNHRFSLRGYQTFRMDREGRQKEGVLILVKNDIPAKDFKIDTGQQSEIHGAYITVGNKIVIIFNLYCPSDKDLALHTMNLPPENYLTVGDFNSHSTSWGYKESDRRGDEVEGWQIENNLLLLNDPEDPPTFFSRRWISASTPDLAFASDDISKITSRKVQNQLADSDHKPVLLAVNMNYKPSNPKTFPRWNYSKAGWVKFATLSDKLCKSVKCDDSNVNRACKNFNKAILEAANRSIPRGARRNYRPYWTEELQELENEVTNCREQVECSPTLNNNIALKASTARYKKAFNKAARTSWKQNTESLNLDKDGQKLWKLTKAMNDEDTKQIPIVIERGQEMVRNRTQSSQLLH
ncbi:hypothetical protein RRG08_011317 [Elysia crispata]|uniref:Endonuclease/exonuclease/phosphatase domain-containing protein n=1 Tax=Elysia crispata TaxID=231223 RepID=A0AAE1CWY1_9GAST|nr:hypothetical protein RRG08_011317 [Elysia crispata]